MIGAVATGLDPRPLPLQAQTDFTADVDSSVKRSVLVGKAEEARRQRHG